MRHENDNFDDNFDDNSNRRSRSRIDQDEFEIRRQIRIIKFKGLDSRSRTSRNRIEQRNSRSRIEQRTSRSRKAQRNSRSRIDQDIENFDEKFRRQIRIEKSRNLNSKFESKIEIREIE